MKMAGNAKKVRSVIWRFVLILCSFCLFSFLGGFLASSTSAGRIDALAYNLNDYNKPTIDGDFVRPYVRIESKEKRNKLYPDLFQQFYYSDNSGSIRQLMQNDSKIELNKSLVGVDLYSQNTLSIQSTLSADGGYRIDYGIFHAYFSDSELGEKKYLGKRFNCDSYIFISDTIADALIEKYGLEKTEDSYLKLINDEKYAVLYVKVDGSKDISFSINNIIYSDKRMGPRCSDFNKYFGLINYSYVSEVFQPTFEIDFKAYSYYISSVLNEADQLGYTVDSYNFRFYKYDYTAKEYFEDVSINEDYLSIKSDSGTTLNGILFVVFVIVSAVAFGALVWFFSKEFVDAVIELSVIVGSLCVVSIVSNFVYIVYLTSIVPLCLLIVFVSMKGGQLYEKFSAERFEKRYLGREKRSRIKI